MDLNSISNYIKTGLTGCIHAVANPEDAKARVKKIDMNMGIKFVVVAVGVGVIAKLAFGTLVAGIVASAAAAIVFGKETTSFTESALEGTLLGKDAEKEAAKAGATVMESLSACCARIAACFRARAGAK